MTSTASSTSSLESKSQAVMSSSSSSSASSSSESKIQINAESRPILSDDTATVMKRHLQMVTADIDDFVGHVKEYTSFRNNHTPMIQEFLDEKLEGTYRLMHELHEYFAMLKKLQTSQDEKKAEPTISKFTFGEIKISYGDPPQFYTHNNTKYKVNDVINYNFTLPITAWFGLNISLSELKQCGHEPGILDKISKDSSIYHVLIGYSFTGYDILQLKNQVDSSDGETICHMTGGYEAIHFSGLNLEPTLISSNIGNFCARADAVKSDDKYVFSVLGREG